MCGTVQRHVIINMLLCMQIDADACILSSTFSADLSEGIVLTSAATLWHLDLATPRRVPLIAGHAQNVSSFITCLSDSTLLATTCKAGPIRVWQVNDSDVRACCLSTSSM
jgi:WD40 repeat protein